MQPLKITIKVQSAKGIVGLNIDGTSNVFFEVELSRQTQRTQTIEDTCNPVYPGNAPALVFQAPIPAIVSIKAMNAVPYSDTLTDFLGQATLTILSPESKVTTLPLTHGGNVQLANKSAEKGCGTVVVEYTVERPPEADSKKPAATAASITAAPVSAMPVASAQPAATKPPSPGPSWFNDGDAKPASPPVQQPPVVQPPPVPVVESKPTLAPVGQPAGAPTAATEPASQPTAKPVEAPPVAAPPAPTPTVEPKPQDVVAPPTTAPSSSQSVTAGPAPAVVSNGAAAAQQPESVPAQPPSSVTSTAPLGSIALASGAPTAPPAVKFAPEPSLVSTAPLGGATGVSAAPAYVPYHQQSHVTAIGAVATPPAVVHTGTVSLGMQIPIARPSSAAPGPLPPMTFKPLGESVSAAADTSSAKAKKPTVKAIPAASRRSSSTHAPATSKKSAAAHGMSNVRSHHDPAQPNAAGGVVSIDPKALLSAAVAGDVDPFIMYRAGDPLLRGALLDARDYSGRSVLHLAAWHGHTALLNELLRPLSGNAPSIDWLKHVTRAGNTVLHTAAQSGRTDTLHFLLQQRGAHVMAAGRNRKNESVVDAAMSYQHAEAAQVLSRFHGAEMRPVTL
jgi:hypothetical protein